MTVLNTKYAKPKPSNAVAVIDSCVDWLMMTYIVAMIASAAPIAIRRRRSVRNSPATMAPMIAPNPVVVWMSA